MKIIIQIKFVVVPNLFILICLCIFSVYSIQLIMGQVLLSATYNVSFLISECIFICYISVTEMKSEIC